MSRGGNRRKNDIGEANKNETSEEIQDSDGNVLAINAKSMIPNFPPPSYEHVLEEARLEQSTATNDNEDETDEMGRIRTGRVNNCTNEVANERIPRNVKGPEILHKSSKELYRAVAKQWGITCKMSDHCRCFDCQSHYFDCDSEKNEQCKSDGGLSAGTPMFISEVIHGTACSLL